MTSKPVIYISSTFFDLQEHRAALIDALEATRVFDVRGMENYGTISQPPLNVCLQDVESSEFYVLLLGRRYGFIPEGYELSITNLEYKQAIGDTDMTRVAGKPAANNRCVLPFIADDNYAFNDATTKAIADEKQKDGEALTAKKEKQLETLKGQVKKDFVMEKNFTSPADLVMKVLGAIIPEMVARKYGSLVNSIQLNEEIVYRCDRVKPREDFLLKNSRLFRTFVIHGEKAELPEIFSNNISHYDLNIDRQIEINNLDEYTSTIPQKFLCSIAFTFYQRVYSAYPESDDFDLEQLAAKLIADPDFSNMIIRVEISYQSWQKYYELIDLLFKEMNRIKPKLSGDKNLYLLLIVKYKAPDMHLQENPEAVAVLEKLRSLRLYDIEDWIGTYFYMNKNIANTNRREYLINEIVQTYFSDLDEDSAFPMQEAIKRLTNIVSDFNGNRSVFENYQNLYNK